MKAKISKETKLIIIKRKFLMGFAFVKSNPQARISAGKDQFEQYQYCRIQYDESGPNSDQKKNDMTFYGDCCLNQASAF